MTVPQKISARRPRSSAISAGSPSPISRGPHLSPSGRGSPSGSSRSNSLSARSSPTPSGSPGARQPASGSPVPNLRPILRPTRRVTFPRYQWLHAVPPPPFPTRPRLPMSPTGPVITDHGMDGHRAAWAARMGSVWLHYSLRFAPSTSIPEEMFVAAVTDVALQR
jgi:hypothetical protein